jgi:Mycoplasma protein of unknown function, DUF285
MINFAKAYIGSTLVSNTSVWSRPPDWISLPTVQSTDNKFVGLLAITNDASNVVALTCTTSTGTYTVDWGDGSSPQTYTSGTNAQYQYTYSSVNSVITSAGYKQVVVTVTPTNGGATLNTFSLQVLPSLYSTASGGLSIPWLDIAISGPSLTSLLIATTSIGGTGVSVSLNDLQQINILSLASSYASMSTLCYNLVSLKSFSCSAALTSCVNFSNMFKQCYSLTNLSLFNTSAGTNFSGMFVSCVSLQTVPLFNTANGTDFSYMFNNCNDIFTIPFLNTGKGLNFGSMFSGCGSLNTVPALNTSSGTSFLSMFLNCNSLITVPLLDTSKGTNLSNMFSGCWSLVTIPALNTSSGTNLSSMFYYCLSLVTIPLLDMSKNTNFNNMFQNCLSLTYLPALVTSLGTSFTSTLVGCGALSNAAFSGTKYSISYSASPKLSATELNAIFNGLGTAAGTQTITISNCYGASTCNKTIATGKGWTVVG